MDHDSNPPPLKGCFLVAVQTGACGEKRENQDPE